MTVDSRLTALRALLEMPPQVEDDAKATYRWIYRDPSDKVRLTPHTAPRFHVAWHPRRNVWQRTV
jgi:hypothetical protein